MVYAFFLFVSSVNIITKIDDEHGKKRNAVVPCSETTKHTELNRTNKQNNLHVNWNLNIRNSVSVSLMEC